MTTNNHRDVGDFHEKFGLPNTVTATPGPNGNTIADKPLMDFRLVLIDEEVKELKDALAAGDLPEVADALVDLAYVVYGMAHTLGLPWEELWNDVQRANMSKVRALPDGSNSKRGSGFDVVKPEGWVGPNGRGILQMYGFEV